MTNEESVSDLQLVVGWAANNHLRGLPSSCLGGVLLVVSLVGSGVLWATGGSPWGWTALGITVVLGLALVGMGAIVTRVEEGRGKQRSERCVQELKQRHGEADALILYSGVALPHGPAWKALVVLKAGESVLSALVSTGRKAVRDARAVVQPEDARTLLHLIDDIPSAPSPPNRVMDGFRAQALVLRGAQRFPLHANLGGLTPADAENPLVRILGTLTTTCQQITAGVIPDVT